jgi:hypothetical protein
MMDSLGIANFIITNGLLLDTKLLIPLVAPIVMNLIIWIYQISRPALKEAFERMGKGYYNLNPPGNAIIGLCTVPCGILF